MLLHLKLLLQGNDNIFENNMVCDTCLYASDCGGFMTGREMTWV